ncbi:nucleoside triphosphate pyrophosphohydrolase [Alkalibacter saccharofermentans]|uniref:Tetrapyrrole methylase family protein / MazG family protein n=1 Tax=Alkalibacter saccharofermentans DSM 14828 TaxID=1120975 RepID=A0A1M4YDB6_9FIRM|nr:nucleoside triphosphate pyrophosphohydrolase [Alkalibacter saccharofermentans]SHF03618.1 tetrapyrrole methylase family protein / MazG family protein [Alkalibacter saccharofermentans DSM 14828]
MKNTIYIVGLGPGGLGQMTLETYKIIKNSKNLYLRTVKHPAAEELAGEGVKFETFDSFYEKCDSFEEVYKAIAVELSNVCVNNHQTVYAVPGHPCFAEKSVEILLEMLDNEQDKVEVKVVSALSFLDSMAASLRIDPIYGLYVVDALSINAKAFETHSGIIVTQVYNNFVASELKLFLMDSHYPQDKEVFLVHKAGIIGEKIEKVKLYEIDRSEDIDYLTSLYIPPEKAKNPRSMELLLETMERLRSEDGCPWDREQTFASLRKYIIEEAYEVVDAIERDDIDDICEELGDLLLQVVFVSQIAKEEHLFDLGEVVESINAKLVNRHPHVFGNESREEFSMEVWEKIKREEKGYEKVSEQMDNLPNSFPVYLRAEKAQKKASLTGFDWEDPTDALAKVREEAEELEKALLEDDKKKIDEESGDLLFAVINVLRLAKVDFRESLQGATDKFIRRYKHVEAQVSKKGMLMKELSLDELDFYWKDAKEKGL